MTRFEMPGPALGTAEKIASEFGSLWFRGDDDVMRPAVRATGLWEAGETQLLMQLITPGSRFLDVGAHIGWFSVVAHHAARNVRIDAIEPDPFTARLCELNLFQVGANARTWTCGLGSTRTTLGFSVPEHNPGDSRIVDDPRAAVVVPVVSADEIFDGESFDVIKIDVQGYEEEVLFGMQKIIRRSAGVRLLVEFFPRAIVEGGSRPIDVLSRYRSEGFDVLALVGERLIGLSDDELISVCSNAGPEGFLTLLLGRV